MKKDNKVLYENIMTFVAKEVKKALNESNNQEDFDAEQVATIKKLYEYCRSTSKLLNQYYDFVDYGRMQDGYYLNDDNLCHLLCDNLSKAFKCLNANAKLIREKAEKMNIDLGIKK